MIVAISGLAATASASFGIIAGGAATGGVVGASGAGLVGASSAVAGVGSVAGTVGASSAVAGAAAGLAGGGAVGVVVSGLLSASPLIAFLGIYDCATGHLGFCNTPIAVSPPTPPSSPSPTIPMVLLSCLTGFIVVAKRRVITQDQKYRGVWIHVRELDIGKEIGKGAFKTVYAASLKEPVSPRLRAVGRSGERLAYLHCNSSVEVEREVHTLTQLPSHPHVLELRAAVLEDQKICGFVTARAEGNLEETLRKARSAGQVVSESVLLTAALQVCNAMLQLCSARIVHRDLAARNVLVMRGFCPNNPSRLHCQLSDYGFSRPACYGSSGSGQRPLRWMAPEAIRGKHGYDEKTDVFSFGVLVWELYSGKMPYCHIEQDRGLSADDILSHIVRCNQDKMSPLPKPEGYDDRAFAMMSKCWYPAADRPHFWELQQQLYDLRQMDLEVFISLRYNDPEQQHASHEQAKEVRQQLAKRGVCAYIDDTPAGESLDHAIWQRLERCKVAVVMGSKSYGQRTNGKFCTEAELQYILQSKPYIPVKMSDDFVVDKVRELFNGDIGYVKWPVPDIVSVGSVHNQSEDPTPAMRVATAVVHKLRGLL